MNENNLKYNLLCIKGLNLSTYVGVYEWEKKEKQSLKVDVYLYEKDKDYIKDSLDDVIDYEKLSYEIKKEIESNQFNLIEKVADTIVGICLRYCVKVKVRVHKKFLDDEVYFEKEKSKE